jgi:hypothetical protein
MVNLQKHSLSNSIPTSSERMNFDQVGKRYLHDPSPLILLVAPKYPHTMIPELIYRKSSPIKLNFFISDPDRLFHEFLQLHKWQGLFPLIFLLPDHRFQKLVFFLLPQ